MMKMQKLEKTTKSSQHQFMLGGTFEKRRIRLTSTHCCSASLVRRKPGWRFTAGVKVQRPPLPFAQAWPSTFLWLLGFAIKKTDTFMR